MDQYICSLVLVFRSLLSPPAGHTCTLCGSHRQLGKLYIQEGNIDEAIAIYLEALNYSPENVELFTTLGLMYLQLEDTRKAFDYFGRALTYNPKDT